MKGITHFSVGVAIASCFPEAVHAGLSGSPVHFLCGGIFGLLPDTLDFRLVRFLYRHHVEVAPDPADADPAIIATAIAHAIDRAAQSPHPIRLKLDSIPMGEDRWLRYTVQFDVAARTVSVTLDDIVDTGGHPIAAAPLPHSRRKAVATFRTGIHLEYLARTRVDIFDGPLFALEGSGRDEVNIRFIPWHREWTHSLPLALALGIGIGAIVDWTAGLVAALAFAAHGILDHLGQLGVNLMFPLQRRRRPGLGWMRSSHPMWNFAITWAAGVLIFWNLYRGAEIPLPDLQPGNLLLLALTPYAILRYSTRTGHQRRSSEM